MEQNCFFMDGHSLLRPTEEMLLEAEVAEWQQFASQSQKHLQKDNLLNSRILQLPPNCSELERLSDERSRVSSPSSAYCRAGNTDFLSAIPYARSSYTVKRKLNYEEEKLDLPNNVNVQKTKTYFPFEFVGRATRKSTEPVDRNTTENEQIIHPTMITGKAVRQNVKENAFQTFTIQSETPFNHQQSQGGKVRLKKRPTLALEKHVEQIRRKHAEFNWARNEPQKKFGKFHENAFPPSDMDSQRVPTSPFLERYTSPSLYSFNETPLHSVCWGQATSTTTNNDARTQYYEKRVNQRYPMEDSTNNECWSDKTQDFLGNTASETPQTNPHLYPY